MREKLAKVSSLIGAYLLGEVDEGKYRLNNNYSLALSNTILSVELGVSVVFDILPIY